MCVRIKLNIIVTGTTSLPSGEPTEQFIIVASAGVSK